MINGLVLNSLIMVVGLAIITYYLKVAQMIKCAYHGKLIYSTKQSGKNVFYVLDENEDKHCFDSVKDCIYAIDKHWINGKWYR